MSDQGPPDPVTISIRRRICDFVRAAIDEAQSSGALPAVDIDDLSIERPQRPENGDFSCSLAMKLARPMRMSPRAIGQTIIDAIPDTDAVGKVWLAGPGFINFKLSDRWLRAELVRVIDAGATFGDSDTGRESSVQVEFVSVNPTGPVHVGHARGAVLGSTLANVLSAAGYEVQREYYVNDGGTQMELFYRTAHARYLQQCDIPAEIPDDGYRGEYMVDLGRHIRDQHGNRYVGIDAEDAVSEIGAVALEMMVDSIQQSLRRLGVTYDLWFRERSLFSEGKYDRVMALIDDRGYRREREGAQWFAATELGEEKDAVLVRSNGSPTYFASDVAYHYDKFVEREFDRVVDIWGADHQGHVSRMKAAVSSFGIDPDRLTLMIYQMVTFKQGDDLVRLSKRAGDIITVDDLVSAVGADACRYFFLSRAAETQMEFDLDLATRQSADNPVYYVQYAHARIASILANAEDRDIDFTHGDVSLLEHEAEMALLRKIVILPELVEMMASNLEVHHLPHYAQELATAFHWFYGQCRVISSIPEEIELTRARLRLCQASKIALARCLTLMGMGAPNRM